jgi:AcrR family transcriptional regulator
MYRTVQYSLLAINPGVKLNCTYWFRYGSDMKTKTKAKRLALLRAAADVFHEGGFERGSMAEICARVGGSKATLYNYFPSEEHLFFEVMHQAKEAELEVLVGSLKSDAEDIKVELPRFGGELLRFLYSPDAIAIRRLAIAESGNSEVRKMPFERYVAPTEEHVAEFIKKAMRRGVLRTADPRWSAIHLLSLLESEHVQRLLYGVAATPRPGQSVHPCEGRSRHFQAGMNSVLSADALPPTSRLAQTSLFQWMG